VNLPLTLVNHQQMQRGAWNFGRSFECLWDVPCQIIKIFSRDRGLSPYVNHHKCHGYRVAGEAAARRVKYRKHILDFRAPINDICARFALRIKKEQRKDRVKKRVATKNENDWHQLTTFYGGRQQYLGREIALGENKWKQIATFWNACSFVKSGSCN